MATTFAERLRNEREVGVPRRFSIATIFLLLTLYAVLFRALVSLGADAGWTGLICVFFGIVTIAQMSLFRGVKPRAASLFAGMVTSPCLLAIVSLYELTIGLTEMKTLAAV